MNMAAPFQCRPRRAASQGFWFGTNAKSMKYPFRARDAGSRRMLPGSLTGLQNKYGRA